MWQDQDEPLSPLESTDCVPAESTAVAVPSYDIWLGKAKLLAAEIHNAQWELGDWILLGSCHFDTQDLFRGIPGYLLLHKSTDQDGETCYRSETIPNFYKVTAKELGMAVQTLKNLVHVARVFPVEKRNPRLTFSHHQVAAPYDKREEYLAFAAPEGQPPRTVDALKKHIAQCEGKPVPNASITITVPADLRDKLEKLAEFEDTKLSSVVADVCLPALAAYVADHTLNLMAAMA
jgi:hypothetical protein